MPQSFPTHDAQVITFYSYKGGTGRSMALANVAWILASNGHEVLTIDWDLEAPGLHRYFAPFLEDPKLEDTEGLIDLLNRYQIAAGKNPVGQSDPEKWIEKYSDIQQYTEPLNWRFPNNGRIDLLGPGCQNRRYGERVNRFDWMNFYETFGGAAFLEQMIAGARDSYRFILIDSRTGISDTSGICTVHLPDALAVFYTLNDQSIEGASSVALDALRQRRSIDKDLGFRVFPIATRIELAEKEKLEKRRRFARREFEPLVEFLVDDADINAYFGSMEIPYDPYYAYEEILATLADQPDHRNSVLSSMELIAGHITGGLVTELEQVSESKRSEAISSYDQPDPDESGFAETLPPRERYDVYVSASSADQGASRRVINRLQSFCKVFNPGESLIPGEDLHAATKEALLGSRILVALISSSTSDLEFAEVNHALQAGIRVIPVWSSSRAEKNAMENLPELGRIKGIPLTDFARTADIEKAVRRSLGLSTDPLRSQSTASVDGTDMSSAAAPHRPWWHLVRKYAVAVFIAAYVGIMIWDNTAENQRKAKSSDLTAQSLQIRDNEPVLSLLLAREAVRLDPSDTSVTTLRTAIASNYQIARLEVDGRPFLSATFSPNGTHVLGVDVDGRAWVFDLTDSSDDPASLGRTIDAAWGAPDRSGRPIAYTVGVNGSVARWTSMQGNSELFQLSVEPSTEVAFGPSGRFLLVTGSEISSGAWDVHEGRRVTKLEGEWGLPLEPWSSDGTAYVTKRRPSNLDVFDIKGPRRFSVSRNAESVAPVARSILSPGGNKLFVLAAKDSGVYDSKEFRALGDAMAANGSSQIQEVRSTFGGWPTSAAWVASSTSRLFHGTAVFDAGASPGMLVLGFDDGSVGVWSPLLDPATGFARLPLLPLTKTTNRVNVLRTHPSEFRLVAGLGSDLVTHEYRLGSPVLMQLLSSPTVQLDIIGQQRYRGHKDLVTDVNWSPDGSQLVSASRDGTIRIWDTNTGALDLINITAEELMRITSSRLPRDFSAEERAAYDIDGM